MSSMNLNNFNRILILTRNEELQSIKELKKLAISSGLTPEIINPFDQLHLHHNQDCSSCIILPRTSGILFDDIDLTLSELLIQQGAMGPIPIQAIRILRDKDRQYIFLKSLQLPLVPSILHRGKLESSHIDEGLWIVKSIRGNKGIGIERFSKEDLLDFWSKALQRNDQRYIIQPFIKSALEKRILCLGSKLYAIDKENRVNDDWKKNAQYAEFTKARPSKDEEELFKSHAQKIKDHLKLPAFAIDYILNENEWNILEVNVHPGLEASSEAMGENLYSKYWEALFNKTSPSKLNF